MIYGRSSVIATIRRVFILSIGLFFTFAAQAKDKVDSASHMALYHRYYQLFDTDSTEEFYEVSAQLQQNYIKKGNTVSYYKIRQNEIFYDAAHDRAYQAITKANEMLEDMKNSGSKHYELPYMSLGYIFEQRGCYRIAVHYYQEALDNIDPKDSTGLAHLYSQMASINLTRNSDKAQQWTERMGNIISQDSLYYRPYLTLKGQICFFNGDKDNFFKVKQEFEEYMKRTPALDHSGEHILKIMEDAFVGKYDEALSLLDQDVQDYDDIRRCDIRIRIFKMMGNMDRVLQEVNNRRNLRDSLSSNLLSDNLTEISAAVGIAKIKEKAAKERERWLGITIILLVVAHVLIVSRYFARQRYQKRVEKQNEQLAVAIEEAKESERLKDIFIKHISHEIRTPLNIITGYAQVVNNPAFNTRKEERNKIVQAIARNTVAITDIVNDLLEISHDESENRYHRDDRIALNDFCRQIMEEAEKNNMGHLEFSFQTALPADFTIQSNQGGIERILQQLIGNALKFTEKGRIELQVYEGADDGCVYFAVSDTGVGIPEELHEQVFEQFYKLNFFKQGLGIGLPMSRKIATQLGGTLTVDKDYHDGARFVLAIPVK